MTKKVSKELDISSVVWLLTFPLIEMFLMKRSKLRKKKIQNVWFK